MRGRTTVVITHRLALAQRADRIIVLQGGCIVEEGMPTELMAKGEPGPLAEAFNMWRFREGQFIDESVAAGVAH